WICLDGALGQVEEGRRSASLEATVSSLKDHRALLAWRLAYAPAWRGRDLEALLESSHWLRSADPLHPVWVLQAPRNSPDELAPYNGAGDLAGSEVFPVPEPQSHSDLPDPTIAVVGDETRKSINAVL